MSAGMPYTVLKKCDLGHWHPFLVVDAVTADDAIERVRDHLVDWDGEVMARPEQWADFR